MQEAHVGTDMTQKRVGRRTSKQSSLSRPSFFCSSHLDRVADDYFSRDPVRDIVGVCEQLLEGPFCQKALTRRKTAALCWQRHIPAGKSQHRHQDQQEVTIAFFVFILSFFLHLLFNVLFILCWAPVMVKFPHRGINKGSLNWTICFLRGYVCVVEVLCQTKFEYHVI